MSTRSMSIRSRPLSTSSGLMQDVPGAYTDTPNPEAAETARPSLSQAVHARRSAYTRSKRIGVKIGTWNVASFKGTEKDVGGWFVQGKGVTEAPAGLKVGDQSETHDSDIPDQSRLDEREDVAAQEARYTRKSSTIPHGDPGSLPGNYEVGLYVLGLQEVIDINSASEALKPYTDPGPSNKWKASVQAALPDGYQLVAEQQLLGLLILVYASPDVAPEVTSVSTTSVGTGLMGYMGNKGAVTARIVLGGTTRLVFINSHLAAGADKASLERRNLDTAQIVARTRFEPIQDSMNLSQSTGEQIGEEDFAFWVGDLNYRLESIPGDDVRRLLMLHTRNEYDLSQRSANKIESELAGATESVKRRVEQRTSADTDNSASTAVSDGSSNGQKSTSTAVTLIDQIAPSDDPTSLQTTLASLLPHDELQHQMRKRQAFHDGWQEGPITFLPTYKYDVGSVGVFDSSEKRRAPSWCDRILYRTRRGKLAYEASIQEEEEARKRDAEMAANGTDQAGEDESILYDYDPDTDAAQDEYNELRDDDDGELSEGAVITKAGFEDEIRLESYTAHQRVLSSDHKPLDAVFTLKYDTVVPELKAKVHAEVVRELDKAENETRPRIAVVVDRHQSGDIETSDDDPAKFEGVDFGAIRWASGKARTLTIANTGRVPARIAFIERPVGPGQAPGIAPKWLNLKIDEKPYHSHDMTSPTISLDPGDSINVELGVRIFDMNTVQALNEGIEALDDILLLRVEGGRDHFIPVHGRWLDSTLGRGIDKLIRIPEGGIRKLQHQRPDSSRRQHAGSGGGGRTSSAPMSPISASDVVAEQPVRFSAPRELFRLTECVEELSTRVIAEWDMRHPADAPTSPRASTTITLRDTDEPGSEGAPWEEHPAWPFSEDCWNEQGTEQWEAAISDAANALDCDGNIKASLPEELPALQRLYVVSNLLMLFLRSLPDGIITGTLWSKIDAALTRADKAKPRQSIEEQRTAIQELLSESPSHSISFILITSMLDSIIAEIRSTTAHARHDEEVQASLRWPTSTIRHFATLGNVPRVENKEDPSRPLARLFGAVMIRAPVAGTEKARKAVEERRTRVVEMFLVKDEPG